MEELSGDQYEKVLKYMEAVNEQNFERAANTMKQCGFNVEVAVSNRFQSHAPQRHRPAPNNQNDEQIVLKYIDFTRRKNESWSIIAVLLDILKYLLLAIYNTVIHLLPRSLYLRFFATPFEKIYSNRLRNQYGHKKLEYYLAKTKNLNHRSVLLVISPRKEHAAVLDFLNDEAIHKKIRNNYFLTCYVGENQELAKVNGYKQSPQIIALRWNIFQEVVEVGRQKDIKRVNCELLDRWSHEGRNQFKRDGNVLVKYRNYVARFHGLHYEEDEEEEVSLMQREQERQEIHQQNQAYRLAEEQTRKNREIEQQKRRKAEQEERKIAELQQERRYRKMSIPDQPTSGDIVRISFRCPDGSNIFRNFAADQKVELIYHWVELNEDIEFEDEKRHFQIMYSYPPAPLSSKKERLLSEVFESSQEKVVIRQL